MEDIEIYDQIQADQIEDGDQIVIHDDYLTDVEIVLDDIQGRIITGVSQTTGDRVPYTLHYTDTVGLWSV